MSNLKQNPFGNDLISEEEYLDKVHEFLIWIGNKTYKERKIALDQYRLNKKKKIFLRMLYLR